MKHPSRTTRAIAGAMLLASVTTVIAQSKKSGPPAERYTCYQSFPAGPGMGHAYTYMGYFKLAKGGKYEYGRGKEGDARVLGRGRYKTSAKGVTFLSGPLKGVPGAYTLKEDGRHYIELTYNTETPDKKDDIAQRCNCDEHSKD